MNYEYEEIPLNNSLKNNWPLSFLQSGTELGRNRLEAGKWGSIIRGVGSGVLGLSRLSRRHGERTSSASGQMFPGGGHPREIKCRRTAGSAGFQNRSDFPQPSRVAELAFCDIHPRLY